MKKEGEYFQIGKKCECEARIRAFMRMLRVGEGTGELIKSYDKKTKQTVYVKNDFEKSYTTAYDGNKINDLSTHPQLIYEGESSAAGAYQVMRYVWWELSGFEVKNKSKTGVYNSKNDLLKKYNINDFSEESQDKICLVLMNKQRPNLIRKIINNDIKNSINKEACFIWASLPEDETNSHYKLNGKLQPATPLKDCIEHYEEFFKEEISQKSPLHLKEGFLKELGITCCNNGEKSKWTNPLKNSQRTYYNSSGVHKEQNGAFGPVRLKPDGTKKNHQGLDLFAEVGTSCFACLDGEIVSYKNEGDDGYGNVLVLKVKGEDLRNSKNSYELEFADEVISGSGFDLDSEYIYLRYAHLESALITSGEVKSGEEICKTGDTGNAKNAVNPHLHFEVAMKSSGNGSGLSNRHNPAFFVNLESIDEPKQTKTNQNKKQIIMKNLIRLLTFLLLLGCKENSNKNNNISNKEDLELSEINESKKLKSETIFNVFKENNSSYYYNNYIIIEDKSSTNTYILKKDNISLGKIELNKSYDGPGFSFFINELSSTLSNIIVEATADIGTSWYFSVIINNNRISNTFYIEEPRADSETTSINDFLKVSVDKDMLEYKFVKSKIARYSKIPENFNSDNSYLYLSRKINEDKNKIKDNFSLNGVWKSDCLNGNAKIEFNKEYVNLELIYNQIYINLEKIDESNNTISYKLKEIPKDKGSLGAKLDWENFMNESMVLEIKKRDDSKINFKCLGFYNNKTKKREFLENDFLSELNKEIEITLEKCE